MLLEEQRFLSEDLERLESAISDRIGEEPKQVWAVLSDDYANRLNVAYID